MANTVDEVRMRINALLRERRVTENKMAGNDGALQVRLNQQLSHNKKLSAETLLVVLDYFPDVSAEWLLRGVEMPAMQNVVAGDNNIANNQNTTVNDSTAVRALVMQLQEKDKQINRLIEVLSQQKVG